MHEFRAIELLGTADQITFRPFISVSIPLSSGLNCPAISRRNAGAVTAKTALAKLQRSKPALAKRRGV
jgi:hypothetical protein